MPFLAVVSLESATYVFDDTASSVVVHVPRAGLFSFFGHKHEIAVNTFEGSVSLDPDNPGAARLSLQVNAADLQVLDPDVDDDTRAEIQGTMLGEDVLASDAHPLIRFESASVDIPAQGDWNVRGPLTVRGTSSEVSFSAGVHLGADGSLLAEGVVELRPADFGISPITAAGGTVRTADVIRLEFRVVGRKEGE